MKKSLMNPVFLRNKTNVIAVAALLSISNLSAQTFSDFNYRGNDKIYNDNPLKPGEFYSPILQGCYPDPSITKKGDDYYLVNSSFSMFPGVPIFTSKDLVNWKQVGHVLDRPSQLKVENSGVSHGIYAPDIKYNKHNDTFYMITTQFAGGIGNMVVKTKDPAKGWSEVQKLNFEGIDPSIFFDDDGKAYIVHNDAPPQGTEQYQGHRVIKMWDYDLEKDQVVAGSDKIIVNGGVDLSQKPIWIEGPHIYKKNGKYYLMCAEGGTGGNHSEVIFMADSPKGPFVPAKNNPILTQRYFPRDRKEKVDWAGHADLVEGPNGQWYGVFLAIRPNVNNRVNKGRETFILPVDWSGTYPVFQNGLVPMKPKLKMPQGVQNQTGQTGFFPNGNFTYNDKLNDKNLDFRWIAMRGPRESFITVTKNGVKVNPFATNIKALAPISSLFHRLQHEDFETSVTLDYKPKSEKELAGITLYQSETFNYVFGITKKDKDFYIVLERTEKGQSKLIASEKISLSKPVKLQVVADKDEHNFNYSLDGRNYKNLGGPVSGDILSTDVAGGFTGSLIGLYSTSSNDIVPN
ncbi:Beta-xylosidase [Chryseobacterium gleum]|uniref:Beta-xylosidase n=2 Tax=Chryseobacterium gleum TaxID=250 RepID=A0A448AZG7_CHRGE|nr:glycoside hydrolase family 43 protein [Chryseobacterium gleum]EFK34202.1 glycosyl hydrolase, family 43 [Chryseobacterium gleum ATCC 35910]QQY30076.1 glycoside hydrolase family 43 protein [Chryseobacterium gleum]VEE05619.1 Beta-xylosidase [Chryseobacterium gleum]